MEQQIDHRWSARQKFNPPLVARITHQSETAIPAEIVNMGMGGALIVTMEILVPSDVINVKFDIAGRSYSLSAVVIWDDEGTGIMFTEYSTDAVRALRAALYPN